MISNTFMMGVGTVMVLQNVQLCLDIFYNSGSRRSKVDMVSIMCLSLILVMLVPTLFAILAFQYTYYAVATVDFMIAVGLLTSVWQTLRALDTVIDLPNFDGRAMISYFGRLFGISFISACLINFSKSFLLTDYKEVVQNRPYIFSTVCFVSNCLDQIMPFVLMLVMHRKNFTGTAQESN